MSKTTTGTTITTSTGIIINLEKLSKLSKKEQLNTLTLIAESHNTTLDEMTVNEVKVVTLLNLDKKEEVPAKAAGCDKLLPMRAMNND